MKKLNKMGAERMSDKVIGRLADEWAEKLWERILERISTSHSKKEIQKFLESILSEGERKLLLRRLAILALVRSGKSYKEIGRILWVSPQTVSAIKKNFSGKERYYKSHKKFSPVKEHTTSQTPISSPVIDLIFDFLSLPIKIAEGFFIRGMGVTDRSMDKYR